MTQLTKLTTRRFQHICIFGDAKSGKSTLAAQLPPETKKIIWLSVDNGHDILFKLPKETQEKIDLISLPDTKESPIGIRFADKVVLGKKVTLCNIHKDISCSRCTASNLSVDTVDMSSEPASTVLVIDNITQLADSAMNLTLLGKKDDYLPGWPEFRLQGTIMNRMLTGIQQSNRHVICIAHVCETEMEDSTKRLVPLVGTVPFSRGVGKYFDHIIYARTANKKHGFGSSTTYATNALTGSRNDVEIEKLEVPSLTPFFPAGSLDDDEEATTNETSNLMRRVISRPYYTQPNKA